MRYTLYRALRTLVAAVKYRNFCRPIPSPTIRTIAVLNAGATIAKLAIEEEQEETDKIEVQSLNEVKNACIKNDDALKDLIEVLSACLVEISKEYQQNIEHQIEIIARCTKLGPVGEHWDELTKFRIEAIQLREELTKYELLVQKVGQMAYNQAVTSLLSGIEDAMDLLEVNFSNLEKTVSKLSKENYQYETKLLKANRDSILHGLK